MQKIKAPLPIRLSPTLACLVKIPPHTSPCLHEVKFDGYTQALLHALTPEQARELARDLLNAADDAER
jgi:hypothetical protein